MLSLFRATSIARLVKPRLKFYNFIGLTLFHQNFTTKMTSQEMKVNLSGIFPPIPTPFLEDESIDFEGLEKNFAVWNELDFTGYVVQGSNGEYVYLNNEERVEVVRRARLLAPKNKLIIAGSGCESTRETILLSREMAKVGADALLVVTPCYYKNSMTNLALYEHYVKVADASTIPVVLYSVPSNTGIDLDKNLVAKLAQHPNIIGLKDSGGDIVKISEMVYKTRNDDFQILAGSSSFLYPAIISGCVGGVCALANVLGREVCELYDLIKRGDHTQARVLQQRLIAPNTMVTRRYGVAGLKVAMDHFGLKGGSNRGPLRGIATQDKEECLRAFTDNSFFH